MNSTKENIIFGSIILFQIFWILKVGEFIKQPEFFIPNEISIENFFFFGTAIGAGLLPMFIVWIISLKIELKKAKNRDEQ